MSRTKIGWSQFSWNPVSGCTPTSSGCKFCYAGKMAKRLQAMGTPGYEDGFKVTLHPDKLTEPYHWRKPRLVFVCSMGDLFHESVPTDYIEQVFEVMEDCPWHIFQVLTKRPGRMAAHAREHGCPANVWLGTSVEDSGTAVARTAELRGVHTTENLFLSCEPAIGYVPWVQILEGIEWLIIGCESGSGRRWFNNEWARSAIKACCNRIIPVFVKQIIVDGKVSRDPSEWPEKLQVQEYPAAMLKVLEAKA